MNTTSNEQHWTPVINDYRVFGALTMQRKSNLLEHAQRASKIVASWPKWKQDACRIRRVNYPLGDGNYSYWPGDNPKRKEP